MRNITRVDGAWWVRFFHGRLVLDHAYFSDRQLGGYDAALQKAQGWRNAAEVDLGPVRALSGLRCQPMPHKRSGCPVGISASIRSDRRRRGGPLYLVFSVAYRKSDGRATNKVFQVGNIETITPADSQHAALTAQACRDEYAWCREHKRPFDPSRYADWRNATYYPFEAPREVA
jgi:hypothetical protein